jgi:hypothetical protein
LLLQSEVALDLLQKTDLFYTALCLNIQLLSLSLFCIDHHTMVCHSSTYIIPSHFHFFYCTCSTPLPTSFAYTLLQISANQYCSQFPLHLHIFFLLFFISFLHLFFYCFLSPSLCLFSSPLPLLYFLFSAAAIGDDDDDDNDDDGDIIMILSNYVSVQRQAHLCL